MTASDLLTMSRKELDRAEWMLRIHQQRMTQVEAAERLGLSVLQVERLYRAYQASGAAALVSKKRGRPSSRRLADALHVEAVGLVRDKYGDFGPTLARDAILGPATLTIALVGLALLLSKKVDTLRVIGGGAVISLVGALLAVPQLVASAAP